LEKILTYTHFIFIILETKVRILIIEDEPELQSMLKINLEDQGFFVDTALGGDKGSYLGRTNDYDAILLDYLLPEKQGDEICREIRDAGKTCPIIVVSVRGAVPDKVELLNMGADDYITKPFAFDELLARMRAVMRRPSNWQDTVLTLDNLVVDPIKYKAIRDDKELVLTRKEFALLEYLMRNKEAVVSRGAIMEHVWDLNGDIFSSTIETHILNLRKKIDTKGQLKLIHTISGRGYKIDLRK
jgi:DNA-binding response OmpR family regulator